MNLYTTVTGILVTGKTVDRFALAQRAVLAWQGQRWHTRHELLVINDHPTIALFPSGPPTGIRELRIKERHTLGELRNIGIEQAQGEYIIQWDDDDYSGADRIAWQIENTVKGRASLLRYEVHCDLTGAAFVNDGKSIRGGGFPGTMCWPRATSCRFPGKNKREDTEFIWQLRRTCGLDVLLNDPLLYCRFYHGTNTWSKHHIMTPKHGARKLTAEESLYVKPLIQATKQHLNKGGCIC